MNETTFESASVTHCQTCTCLSDHPSSLSVVPHALFSNESRMAYLAVEMQRNQIALTALQREYNTFIPASTLPAHILSEIFLLYATQYRETHTPVGRWIPRFAHVCDTWRQAALHTPRLWMINFRWPATASEILAATTCPLYLRYDLTDTDPRPARAPDILRETLFQRTRVGELLLVGGVETMQLTCAGIEGVFPNLTHLSLLQRWISTSRAVTPDCFEATEMPVLRSLHLQNLRLDTCRSLATSSLTAFNYNGDTKAPLKDIIDLLRQMPRLRSLTLGRILPKIPHQVLLSEVTPSLHMESLDHLDLSGNTIGVLAMLRALRIPAVTSVRTAHYMFLEQRNEGDALSLQLSLETCIWEALRTIWHQNHHPSTIHINRRQPFSIHFGSIDPQCDTASMTMKFDLSDFLLNFIGRRLNAYEAITLSLSNLETDTSKDYDWPLFYGALSNIEHLFIQDRDSLRQLAEKHILSDVLHGKGPALPGLRIVMVRLSDTIAMQDRYWLSHPSLLPDLTREIAARQNVQGVRDIERVVLVGDITDIDDSELKELRDTVGVLVTAGPVDDVFLYSLCHQICSS